jgi:phage-related protein
MATFPVLKTGAVAQYPLNRGVRFSTQAVRFMDGSQQKYRLIGKGLRKWTLKLDQLDEQELAAVIAFAEQQGSASFAFTDPVTNVAVANCILSGEEFNATMNLEMNGQTTIVIEEIA